MNFASPSMDFLRLKGMLVEIAGYAKAANQMDLFNQAKEAHDNLVRQYNAQRPKSSSPNRRWTPFSVEDTTISAPEEYLEEDSIYQVLYEHAKTLSQYELNERLRKAVDSFNSLSKRF